MQIKFLFWCCFLVAAPHTALAQVQPDDAGDTVATAGVLHTGVNACRSDYLLPRRMDVDVWVLRTEVGRVYRVSSHPVDDVTEALWSLPLQSGFYSLEGGLRTLGYETEPYWVRGDGRPLVYTIKGVASNSGESRRYEIVVEEHADDGDLEPDSPEAALPLAEGDWRSGVVSPSFGPSGTDRNTGLPLRKADVDCFSFPYADRGLYRVELEQEGETTPTNVRFSLSANEKLLGEPDATLGLYYSGRSQLWEMRGPGLLRLAVTRTGYTGPERVPYRVRITRVGTGAPDDHGNLPSEATPIVAGVAVRGVLGAMGPNGLVSGPGPDADWFALQALPHHAYIVRINRGGLYSATLNEYLLRVLVPWAEEQGIGFYETPLFSSFTMNYALRTLRFRGRDDGRPVRFGLTGGTGGYTFTATDLGVVTDSGGDQLSQPGHLSIAHPTVTGALEYPTDVDSFIIDPPEVSGVYRLECTVPYVNNPGVLYPGMSVVSRNSDGFQQQYVSWHSFNTYATLFRRTGGGVDSFPARVDMLNKTYPAQLDFPASGVVYHYTLRLVYDGPIDLRASWPTPPDDAPSGADVATVLPVGRMVRCSRQSESDDADTVLVQLEPGRLYLSSREPETGNVVRVIGPDGAQIRTDPYYVENSPFWPSSQCFTVGRSGLYQISLRYGGVVRLDYTFQLGVVDAGPSNDEPGDDGPRIIREGVTRGRFDHAGDHDPFYLPFEPGALYRLTFTSEGPATLAIGGQYYGAAAPFSGLFYMPNMPMQQDVFLTVTSNETDRDYTIALEKVYQVRPSDDLPGTPESAPFLRPGEELMILFDHPLDVDTFRIAVAAGHRYRLLTRWIGREPDAWSSGFGCTLRDEQGRSVDSGNLGDAFHAFEDGVWHADLNSSSWSPCMVRLVDDGVEADDVGTGEFNRGHVTLGETLSGVLTSSLDRDLWEIEGIVDSPAHSYQFTMRGRGAEVLSEWTYSSLPPGSTVSVGAGSVPADAKYPYPYSIAIREAFDEPLRQSCPGDFGGPGGRATPDHMHDTNDLVVFIDYFFRNYRFADVGSAGGVHMPDGWLDNNDFVVMVDLYFTECP